MNVDGRKEECGGVVAREGEGHRMNGHGARFEFEDGETVGFIGRQFAPGVLWETEAFVEPGEIVDGGDEGGFEVSNLDDFEFLNVVAGTGAAQEGYSPFGWRPWEPFFHIRKEI